ncbi:MAG: LON peptidase substrate-binding domain-containing protein, partial [Anaerolineales bacterium]|nr:LON peptidase substrate-binding domain-containing protein [Anaerolineales bacterium]
MSAQFSANPPAAALKPADIPDELPILPIDNAVLFPAMMLPLAVSGDIWVKLVDETALASKMIGVFWRTQPGDTFDPLALAQTGTGAQIMRMLRLPDGSVQLLLQGQARVQIQQLTSSQAYPTAQVAVYRDPAEPPLEVAGLARGALTAFQQVVQLSPALPDELAIIAANVSNPGTLADLIAANLNLKLEEQQSILDTLDISQRLERVLGYLERERELLAIGQKAQEEMSRSQRDYVLRQQLEAIKRELGETDDRDAELAELRRRLEEANLPEEPRQEAERELARLERMPPGAAEYVVTRTYLDWLLGLPWNISTVDNLDLAQARQVLDEDHYDLERVKERIIEYLAVLKLQHAQGAEHTRGPILCFVGPPGVGKTSLGQSIARALGRKFVRVALGGVRDEAEIRGFRRTYIGALPGRIIQGINRAGSNNPVLMIDEVDKLAVGLQGDPAAALLELLDPEQNRNFVDRYLDVPFDMSRVLFICTANQIETIPSPLLDRMELLRLAGYTEAEKLVIARRYLIPRQMVENGLAPQTTDRRPIREPEASDGQAQGKPPSAKPPLGTADDGSVDGRSSNASPGLSVPELTDEALRRLIREYTHEAGVRDLERRIGAIYRKMATRLAEGQPLPERIDGSDLDELLGPPRFRPETLLGADEVGVVTGLAWTPAGGDVLFVEASAVPGSGQLTLTGQLGDIMRESARAALTYTRGRAEMLGIPADFAQKYDIHIHVPAGAVPKDGPSAGITMASALVSA